MEREAEYHISSSIKDGILEIALTGELIASAFEEVENQILYIIKAGGVKNLLMDARAIKGRTGIMKTYIAARRPLPNIPKMNVAFVDLPENENAAQQISLTAIARIAGHSLNFFADIDAAREWLKSKLREDELIVMKEKRKAERLEVENEVTITVISDRESLPKEKITDSYSMDISVLGTKIKTHVLLPIDTLLMVEFSLEDLQQKINAMGKVKWIKVVIEDESYEAGVEFASPSKKLAEYIGWKQKSKNPKPV